VFPTLVGINRIHPFKFNYPYRVPHASGDKPLIKPLMQRH